MPLYKLQILFLVILTIKNLLIFFEQAQNYKLDECRLKSKSRRLSSFRKNEQIDRHLS